MTRKADEARLARNDTSRNRAENHRQSWDDHELEVLMSWADNHTEERLIAISEELGRTIEACRQRYYEYLNQGTRGYGKVSTSSPHARWLDDDEWPSWYVRG